MANLLPILLIGGAAAVVMSKKKKKKSNGGSYGDFAIPAPKVNTAGPSGATAGVAKWKARQQSLAELTRLGLCACDPGKPDGKYGTNTKNAIKAFQRYAGIGDDGKWGSQTEAAMQQALASVSNGQAPAGVLDPSDIPPEEKGPPAEPARFCDVRKVQPGNGECIPLWAEGKAPSGYEYVGLFIPEFTDSEATAATSDTRKAAGAIADAMKGHVEPDVHSAFKLVSEFKPHSSYMKSWNPRQLKLPPAHIAKIAGLPTHVSAQDTARLKVGDVIEVAAGICPDGCGRWGNYVGMRGVKFLGFDKYKIVQVGHYSVSAKKVSGPGKGIGIFGRIAAPRLGSPKVPYLWAKYVSVMIHKIHKA